MLASLFKKKHPTNPSLDINQSALQDEEVETPVHSTTVAAASLPTTPDRSYRAADASVLSLLTQHHPNLSMFKPKRDQSSSRRDQPSPSSPSHSPTASPGSSPLVSRTPIKKLFSRSRSMSLGDADQKASAGADGELKAGEEPCEQWYTPDRSEVEAYEWVSPSMVDSPSLSHANRDNNHHGSISTNSSIKHHVHHASPHRSPYRSVKASLSSPALSLGLPKSPSAEQDFYSFHQEDMPLGTPGFGKKGILREGFAGMGRGPGTGNSVRFFSRDQVCIISPNASLVSQSVDDSPIHQQQYPMFDSTSSEFLSPDSSVADEQTIDQFLHRQPSTSPQSDPPIDRYGSTSPLSSPATSVLNAFPPAPSTPLTPTTLGSTSFLDRLRTVSASSGTPDSTPNRTQRQISGEPSLPAFTRPRSQLSSVIRFEPEEESPNDQPQEEDEAHISGAYMATTTSMQLHTLQGDESNLLDQSERLPEGEDTELKLDTITSTIQEPSRNEGDSEATAMNNTSIQRPVSNSFPFASLESSGRSYASTSREPLEDEDEGELTQFHTVIYDLDDRLPTPERSQSVREASTTPPGTPFVAVSQTRFASSSPSSTPPYHLAYTSPFAGNQDVTIYHTPSRPSSSYFTSSHSQDRTTYHTPRSTSSALASRLEYQLAESPGTPVTHHDRESVPSHDTLLVVPFDPELSFARSLVDKGLSPSPSHQNHLAPQHQSHASISSDLILTIDPESPSSAIVRRSIPSVGHQTLIPSNLSAPEVLALNAEFYASQQNLIQVYQAKYELQTDIARELEGALGRRDEEIRMLKAAATALSVESASKTPVPPQTLASETNKSTDVARTQAALDQQTRDLEIRLESERRESATLRDRLDAIEFDRQAANAREDELRAIVGGLEEEIKELGVQQLRRVEEDGAGGDRTELVTELREKLAERELALWELRKEVDSFKQQDIDVTEEKQAEIRRQEQDEQEKERLQVIVDGLKSQVQHLSTLTPSTDASQASSDQAEAIQTLTATLVAVRTENEQLQAEATKDKTKLEENRGELEHQWKMADRAWEEIEGFKNQIKIIKQGVIVKEAAHKEELAQLEANLDSRSTAHETAIATLAAELAALTSDNTQLSASLQSVEAEFLSLGEVLNELEAERDGLHEQLATEQEEMNAAKARLEEVEKERDEAVESAAAAAMAANEKEIHPEEEEWRVERDQVLEERDELTRQRDEAWEEADALQARLDETKAEVDAFNERTAQMETSLASSLQQVQDLTTRHAAEIAQLVQLRASHADALASKEHHLAQSRKYRDLLSASDATLATQTKELFELKAKLDGLEDDSARKAREARETFERAEEETSKQIRDLTRTIASQTAQITSLEQAKQEQQTLFESAIRDRASAEISAHLSSTRVEADSGELERLSKEVARLRSEEAQRELRIVHLTRSRAEVRESLEGMEIALDSKQQELELVKRKFGVRGVAGANTPAAKPISDVHTFAAAPSSTRRESLATTLSKAAASRGPETPIAPTPSGTRGGRARQSLATSTVQETPVPSSRTHRPRSSLAMGTPGLHRHAVPVSEVRPRSSLGLTSSSSSSTKTLAVPSVPATSQPASRTLPQSSTNLSKGSRPRLSSTPSASTLSTTAPSTSQPSSTGTPRSHSSTSLSSTSQHSVDDEADSDSQASSIKMTANHSDAQAVSSSTGVSSTGSLESLESLSLLSSSALDASLNRSVSRSRVSLSSSTSSSSSLSSSLSSRIPLATSSSNHLAASTASTSTRRQRSILSRNNSSSSNNTQLAHHDPLGGGGGGGEGIGIGEDGDGGATPRKASGVGKSQRRESRISMGGTGGAAVGGGVATPVANARLARRGSLKVGGGGGGSLSASIGGGGGGGRREWTAAVPADGQLSEEEEKENVVEPRRSSMAMLEG